MKYSLNFSLRLIINSFVLSFLIFSYSVYAQAPKTKSLIFAVVPQMTSTEIYRLWIPIIERIKISTGGNVELRLYSSIPKFEADFLEGKMDVAYMNPYHAVMAKRKNGYYPILRDGEKLLTGILVVASNSKIKSISDLSNKELAFPAPNAFGASLYLRAILTEKYKLKFTSHYLRTHGNVYRSIVVGDFAAGGGVNSTLLRENNKIKEKLKILFKTPGVPSHPIVVHPRVPKEVVDKIISTFLELGNDQNYKQILRDVQIPKPIKSTYEKDYKFLENYKLDNYVIEGEE